MWDAGKKSPLQNFYSSFIQRSFPLKWVAVEHLRCEKFGIQDFAKYVDFLYYCEKILLIIVGRN